MRKRFSKVLCKAYGRYFKNLRITDMQGYISLHRKIRESCIWETGEKFDTRSAWIDLLLSANHADKEIKFGNRLIDVKRGSFITSELQLSNRWKWSRHKVDNFLQFLEGEQMIVLIKDNKKTTINIVNYDTYQKVDDEQGQQKSNKRTSKGHQKDTNNNENNVNNINPLYPPMGETPLKQGSKTMLTILQDRHFSKPVEDVMTQWLKYKVEKKNGYKETGLKVLLDKVERLVAEYGDDAFIDVVIRSMEKNYQGIVYEWLGEKSKNEEKGFERFVK